MDAWIQDINVSSIWTFYAKMNKHSTNDIISFFTYKGYDVIYNDDKSIIAFQKGRTQIKTKYLENTNEWIGYAKLKGKLFSIASIVTILAAIFTIFWIISLIFYVIGWIAVFILYPVNTSFVTNTLGPFLDVFGKFLIGITIATLVLFVVFVITNNIENKAKTMGAEDVKEFIRSVLKLNYEETAAPYREIGEKFKELEIEFGQYMEDKLAEINSS